MHILVVDDQPGFAESLAELLKVSCPVGTSFDVALDGLGAVLSASRKRPGVIIIDINMPVMNGMDASAMLCRLLGSPKPLLIAMSGNPDNLTACRLTGFFAEALVKPLNMQLLLKTILPALTQSSTAHAGIDSVQLRLRGEPAE